jgi:hypothetical protein
MNSPSNVFGGAVVTNALNGDSVPCMVRGNVVMVRAGSLRTASATPGEFGGLPFRALEMPI